MTRHPALTLATVAFLFPTAAACSTSTAGEPKPKPTTPTAARFDTTYDVTNPGVSVDAVHPFTTAQAAASQQFVIGFVEDFAFREPTIRSRKKWTAEDFADVGARMTPETADWWAKHVNIWVDASSKVYAKDEKPTPREAAAFTEAFQTLWGVTIFGIDCIGDCKDNKKGHDDPKPVNEGPVVTNPTLTIGEVFSYVDNQTGENLMAVDVSATADLRVVTHDGKPGLAPMTWKNRFALQPQPNGEWLLHGWSDVRWTTGDVVISGAKK